MELSNPLKMLPSQYYLPLAIVAGGFLAWRFMFSGSGGDETVTTNTSMGYDPSLVALGVETSLERDKLAAQTELGKMSMQTELQALDKEYTYRGVELASAERLADKEYGYRSAELASNERKEFGNIGLQHAELSVMQNLGQQEIAQSYNLQNYQTMVQHDLGKKGISASKFNSVIGGLTSIFGK